MFVFFCYRARVSPTLRLGREVGTNFHVTCRRLTQSMYTLLDPSFFYSPNSNTQTYFPQLFTVLPERGAPLETIAADIDGLQVRHLHDVYAAAGETGDAFGRYCFHGYHIGGDEGLRGGGGGGTSIRTCPFH